MIIEHEVRVYDRDNKETFTYPVLSREDALTFAAVWGKDRYEVEIYRVERTLVGEVDA